MKKFFVMAIIALSVGLSASAETVLMEYYGTKARNSYTNPCKGETIRKCAVITKDIQIQQHLSTVTETVMDREGRVLNCSSYTTIETPETIVRKILATVPDNAVATVISDNERSTED